MEQGAGLFLVSGLWLLSIKHYLKLKKIPPFPLQHCWHLERQAFLPFEKYQSSCLCQRSTSTEVLAYTHCRSRAGTAGTAALAGISSSGEVKGRAVAE